MANAFISYSRHHEAVARTLAADLVMLGHTPWFDEGLTGGQAWWDEILARVRDCAIFIFVLDRDSLDSVACQREYGYAADLGKPILPVLIDDRVSINLLPPSLARIQFVDYRTQDRSAAFRLAKAISAVPAPAALPNPLPEPPVVPVSYLGGLAERVGATALSYEEQSALLVDLKRSLRDPKSMTDTRTLLERLRKRHDLFANIAEEIDDALGAAIAKPVAVPAPATAAASLSGSRVEPGPETVSFQPEVPDSDVGRSINDRINGAIALGCFGFTVGIIYLAMFVQRFGDLSLFFTVKGMDIYTSGSQWYLFAIGGAVAGAISGRDHTKRVAAQIGMSVGFLVYAVPMTYIWLLSVLGMVMPVSGSLVGAYLARRKASMAGPNG